MSDEMTNPAATTLDGRDEMTVLRERAQLMGLTIGPNIKLETLRKRVADAIEGKTEEVEEEAAPKTVKDERELSPLEKEAALRKELYETHMKLVRVRIACMNPADADLRDHTFTVSNKYLGKVSRVVPMNTPWHVEAVLLDHIRERMFTQFNIRKNGQNELPDPRDVRAYSIEILEPLSEAELKRIAAGQLARGED